jgi:hypothetical protein
VVAIVNVRHCQYALDWFGVAAAPGARPSAIAPSPRLGVGAESRYPAVFGSG